MTHKGRKKSDYIYNTPLSADLLTLIPAFRYPVVQAPLFRVHNIHLLFVFAYR